MITRPPSCSYGQGLLVTLAYPRSPSLRRMEEEA
jgi:hypothetical protein